MGYRTLRACVDDLSRSQQLLRIDVEVDAHLEAAEIHRRVYAAGGPALYFSRVKGCRFPMVSNLFGTLPRARYLFRDMLATVERLVELKIDPAAWQRKPWRYWRAPFAATKLIPWRVRSGPATACETTIDQLPALQCWPRDGGPFVTLPLVHTEDPDRPGWRYSNLGMYRVQLSGNQYEPNREVGLHYQLHRGIGVHHAAAIRRGERLPVNILIGGPPAWALAAVMPFPEGLPEVLLAALLSGHATRWIRRPGHLPIPAEADFCISGWIDPTRTKPEGPFGDHLGYYSLTHEFPVMTVDRVYHRPDAIWPFTVVGRPPQEDTTFGELIHELTGPVIPTVVNGVKAVHAVDAAGVHPLLLAIGSERYVPYEQPRQPRELLTCANAILGQGQLSLAKYLWIAAEQDDPHLAIHDIQRFFEHMLRRVDWRRDLHFQTRTTIDTLDYSGDGLNDGSKVVIAAAGPIQRELPTTLPSDLHLPDGFTAPRVCFPGVLAIRGPRVNTSSAADAGAIRQAGTADIRRFCSAFRATDTINGFPLIVIVDDSEFTAATLSNWLWVVFTRSNPAVDIDGIDASMINKHWGCAGSLVIDARIKPHHAPPLEVDPAVSRRVDQLAAPGGPLHGII